MLSYLFEKAPFYRGMTVLWLMIVTYFSVIKPEDLPVPTVWDKAEHFIAYCCLAVGLYLSRLGLPVILVIIISVGYSMLIEIIQYFLPYRMFDWWDMLANSLGAVVGLFMILQVEKSFLKRRA